MPADTRVLVADDDLQLLETVAKALRGMGAEVVQAESGAELIEQLANEGPFDLVITDISMPWMSGLQAMRSVRTVGLGMPVIVMTALDDDRVSAQVEALGRNAVLLRKPFELHELESVMALLLSYRQPSHSSADARST
jgi:CheY-like chemotaxis protein